jgi:hypothetical protein
MVILRGFFAFRERHAPNRETFSKMREIPGFLRVVTLCRMI